MDDSWLNELLKDTDQAETPRSWILWSGLSAIGAVSSFNVHLDRFYYKLHPNMYVMLIGKSGLGKGLGTWLAKTLVEQCDVTRVIAGRNSIESVIQDLSRSKANEKDGKLAIKDARGYLISGEFANFVIQSPNAMTILTEWYDTHYMGEWKNSLKHSGVERLRGLSLSLLGAASPAHFKDFVSMRDVEGGFIGRTLLIYAEKRHRINSLTEKPEDIIDTEKLSARLKEIATVKGEFQWTKEAIGVFKPWYEKFRGTDFDDKTGTDQRFPDHVLKVAMCLSLSKRLDLFLRAKEVEQSIEICTTLAANVKRALMGGGKSPMAHQTAILIQELIQSDGPVTRMKLLQKHWGDLDSFDLDRIQVTLITAGAITVESKGADVLYEATDHLRSQYSKWKQKEKESETKKEGE